MIYHSCCLFNHLYLQSFLRHWPSSLVLVHPGQSYLVQLLYGLSAFFTTSRHQRHDAVQSTWRWSLYLHCYTGDQRGWWQRQLQVHDHTCRNTPAFHMCSLFPLSSSQDCQNDRDVGKDLMYFIRYCSPAKSIKLIILNHLITSWDHFSFSCCHLVSEMGWSEESGTWRRLNRGLVLS